LSIEDCGGSGPESIISSGSILAQILTELKNRIRRICFFFIVIFKYLVNYFFYNYQKKIRFLLKNLISYNLKAKLPDI
jgi:hypothetical protein